jgi:Zn-dependent protease
MLRCRALADVDFGRILISFVVLLLSLTVHEAAHAWSADRLGDPTARLLGRLTLNPTVHADLIGTVLFPLIAMTTGLPLIGWAKPVPVSMQHLRSPRRDFALIAAAGPLSNVLLAVVAAICLLLVPADEPSAVADALFSALLLAVMLNVLLAVFNMIPIPPLDGGNVLMGVLPEGAARVVDGMRPYGFLLLYALMLTGVLGAIMRPVQGFVIGMLRMVS